MRLFCALRQVIRSADNVDVGVSLRQIIIVPTLSGSLIPTYEYSATEFFVVLVGRNAPSLRTPPSYSLC